MSGVQACPRKEERGDEKNVPEYLTGKKGAPPKGKCLWKVEAEEARSLSKTS